MTTLRWLLAAAGLILAAFFGMRTYYQRQLDRERQRVLDAHADAIKRGDNEAAATHAAAAARIELALERERQRGVVERIRQAVTEARRRRAQ